MSRMAIEKYIGRPRFTRPSYRDRYTGKVTVDEEGRVFLFGTEEVGPIMLESRFHFFEAETGDNWPRVRARHGLPKTKRRSCYSYGVRQGEGYKVGLYPSRPIHVIHEERGTMAGEKSGRMPAYGKQFERMVKRDIAEAAAAEAAKPKSTTDSTPRLYPFEQIEDEELPF